MELKELPKVEEKEKELTQNEKTNLFNSIVLGKDVTEKIETSRGIFEVKFPRMKDIEVISRMVAYRLNGLSIESFDTNSINLMYNIATLDVLIIDGPAWYRNAKEENNFTWGDIPIQSFVQEVFAKATEFRFKIQNILEQNTNDEDSRVDNASNDNAPVKSGLFSGLFGKK